MNTDRKVDINYNILYAWKSIFKYKIVKDE